MMAGWAPYHTLRVRHSSGASLFHIAIVGAWDDYRSLGVEVDKAFFFHGAMSRYSPDTHQKNKNYSGREDLCCVRWEGGGALSILVLCPAGGTSDRQGKAGFEFESERASAFRLATDSSKHLSPCLYPLPPWLLLG